MIQSTYDPCLAFAPSADDEGVCVCGWLAADHADPASGPDTDPDGYGWVDLNHPAA